MKDQKTKQTERAMKIGYKANQIIASRAKLSVAVDFDLVKATDDLLKDVDGFDVLAQTDAQNAFGILLQSLDEQQLTLIKGALEDTSYIGNSNR